MDRRNPFGFDILAALDSVFYRAANTGNDDGVDRSKFRNGTLAIWKALYEDYHDIISSGSPQDIDATIVTEEGSRRWTMYVPTLRFDDSPRYTIIVWPYERERTWVVSVYKGLPRVIYDRFDWKNRILLGTITEGDIDA